MAALKGVDKVPKTKAGIRALTKEFYDQVGIDENTVADEDKSFANWTQGNGINEGRSVYSGYEVQNPTGKDNNVREPEGTQRDLFAPTSLPEETAKAQTTDTFDVQYR